MLHLSKELEVMVLLSFTELEGVRWVLPDSYLDVKSKDYGGEPFINGQAVPYDPKYHEEWIRNNNRANEKKRCNDRPRNFDRSRNFERRRENMQNSGNFQTVAALNQGGRPSTPNDLGGGLPQNNMGNGAGLQIQTTRVAQGTRLIRVVR